MSEEVKKEEIVLEAEVIEEKTQEPEDEEETAPIEEEVESKVQSTFSDIFVTESDTFEIKVQYYKQDDVILVADVDDSFDSKKDCKEFSITFKYPDQGDSSKIAGRVARMGSGGLEDLDVREFLNLEFARVLCLIRSWTIDQDLTNQNILKLHPKIVKAIITQVREKLGMDGII